MTNKSRKNDVNEELPDEHDFIQHSLRSNQEKQHEESRRRQQATRAKQSDNTQLDKAGSPSNRTTRKK